MEEEKIKGPNTKLLECEALVIRTVGQDPTTDNLLFEVFISNNEGKLLSIAPIFRAIETTPPVGTFLDRLTSPEHQPFNLNVLYKDKENQKLDETPFMEIDKTKDTSKSIYKVRAKEKTAEENVGILEFQYKSSRTQFKVIGMDSLYLIEENKPSRFSLKSLLCCGKGTRTINDEVTIFETDKLSGVQISDLEKRINAEQYVKEPVGKIVKLQKRDAMSKRRDILVTFPKNAYNEERSLLLALTFLLAARFFQEI